MTQTDDSEATLIEWRNLKPNPDQKTIKALFCKSNTGRTTPCMNEANFFNVDYITAIGGRWLGSIGRPLMLLTFLSYFVMRPGLEKGSLEILVEMEKLSVYHGAIGMKEGERQLALDGRDGCYLIRNSDSVPGIYCLCVLCQGVVYTYRLYKHDGGSWAAESVPGVPKRHFRKITNLIAAFQQPGQGIAMPLLYPVIAQRRA
ncbi:SH2 domain-containing protein 1A-like [Corythoichthys intestinalis]|uniref:SH2 domain-containing protein 1A-like n=1 Tax=Corythoichthys intestinalis TaxID=161448 RepID=UPI0025A6158A|nr:SH2 domain-containing protein 1A-like [Corythoichthys intestinalis]